MEILAKAIMGQTDRCLDLAPGATDPDGRPGLPRGVHPRLGRIAARALRRKRSERQQSVLELRDEVEGFLQGGGRFDRQSFPAGAQLVRQGEEGHEAYIIVSGRCAAHKRVEGERIDLREMGPGDVFGETSVLTGEPRSATVVALEPLELLVVTREDFDEELQSGVWPGSFLRALAERFRERDREVFALERMARVCAHVLIHLNLAGETTSDGYRRAPWSTSAASWRRSPAALRRRWRPRWPARACSWLTRSRTPSGSARWPTRWWSSRLGSARLGSAREDQFIAFRHILVFAVRMVSANRHYFMCCVVAYSCNGRECLLVPVRTKPNARGVLLCLDNCPQNGNVAANRYRTACYAKMMKLGPRRGVVGKQAKDTL